jgi:hypothetical protein
MRRAEMTLPDTLLREFREELRAAGRTVPAGIAFCPNASDVENRKTVVTKLISSSPEVAAHLPTIALSSVRSCDSL